MGANIAGTYAGVRRARVSQLVMLDFLGLKPAIDDDSPKLFGQWLERVAQGVGAHFHPSCEALAARLMEANPRLTEERATFLSWQVSRMHGDGTITMACDPWHHVASPMVYHIEDTLDCWRHIEAPVLLLIAEHGFIVRRFATDPREFARRLASIPNVSTVSIPDSGHNVQHDQPEHVAAAIEEFLDRD